MMSWLMIIPAMVPWLEFLPASNAPRRTVTRFSQRFHVIRHSSRRISLRGYMPSWNDLLPIFACRVEAMIHIVRLDCGACPVSKLWRVVLGKASAVFKASSKFSSRSPLHFHCKAKVPAATSSLISIRLLILLALRSGCKVIKAVRRETQRLTLRSQQTDWQLLSVVMVLHAASWRSMICRADTKIIIAAFRGPAAIPHVLGETRVLPKT